MNQDINFLNALPKEPQYFTARWIGWLLLLVGAILAMISFSQLLYQFHLTQEVKDARKKQQRMEKILQSFIAQYPLLAHDKPLLEQINDYEKALRTKQTRFKELTHATLRKPFSNYLNAFSKAVPEGLWLTTFNINQDINNISLRGYTLKPVAVSLFIHKLQQRPVFEEVFFDLFYMKKIMNKPYVQFEIANDTLIGLEEHNDDGIKSREATLK